MTTIEQTIRAAIEGDVICLDFIGLLEDLCNNEIYDHHEEDYS